MIFRKANSKRLFWFMSRQNPKTDSVKESGYVDDADF